MAAFNWSASYQDLLLVIELLILERRRLDLKLGQLFKIMHKVCFFPDGNIGNNLLYFTQQHTFSPSFLFTSTKSTYKFFSVFIYASYKLPLEFFTL